MPCAPDRANLASTATPVLSDILITLRPTHHCPVNYVVLDQQQAGYVVNHNRVYPSRFYTVNH